MGHRRPSGVNAGNGVSNLIGEELGDEAWEKIKLIASKVDLFTILSANITALQAIADAISNGATFDAPVWGAIGGTLNNQTDLAAALATMTAALGAKLDAV